MLCLFACALALLVVTNPASVLVEVVANAVGGLYAASMALFFVDAHAGELAIRTRGGTASLSVAEAHFGVHSWTTLTCLHVAARCAEGAGSGEELIAGVAILPKYDDRDNSNVPEIIQEMPPPWCTGST